MKSSNVFLKIIFYPISLLPGRFRGVNIRYVSLVMFAVFTLGIAVSAQRKMENLNRGIVAVDRGSDVFISWRMLGVEDTGIAFNVYRNGTKITGSPVSGSTNYVDANGNAGDSYYVTSVTDGSESQPSETVSVWNTRYKSIPLNRPATGAQGGIYEPNDLSVGDLDGDGAYELVIKWYPSNAKDNSQSGYTDNTLLEGIELDGTSLWVIDLGVNIRSGAHYTQFMVYDLDSDGIAEIACKTAPGTKDGSGSYLSKGPAAGDNDGADYRNSSGYILEGPEYLTVFSGQTGEELATVNYLPPRGDNIKAIWGDDYGNRVDRFLACVAYFDGGNPSLVMCRGYYTRTVLAAWDWDGEQLTHRWTFDSSSSGNSGYAGQGAHSLAVGDVDNDGADEIMYGACAIDHNGTGLYTTGYGHGDATHLGDFDPDRAGLEFFMPHEGSTWGYSYRDAATGSMISSRQDSGDVGRGVAGDVCPAYRGAEFWASGQGTYNAQGESISISPPSTNFLVYWDGDVYRELLDGEVIDSMDASGSTSRLLTAYNYGASSVNGTKSTPGLCADILGDWREEVIWKHSDNAHLLLFTTTIETDHKNYTLMHDPVYRLSIAWQNVAYNQPAHVGYYFPDGAPTPEIVLVGASTNNRPSVQVTSPTTGSVFFEQETIHIVASASDNDGYITRIEFYADEVKIGEATSAPYTIDWFNTTAKDYTLTAVATDNEGATTTSVASYIIVLPGSGSTTITIQENETGFCSVEGSIETTHDGYTGSGFANTNNENGTGVDYKVEVLESGIYTVTIRFANGGTADRPALMTCNGEEVATGLSFPVTDDWDTWDTTQVNLYLGIGMLDLRLEATGDEGLANIDVISLSGPDIQAADCNSSGDNQLPVALISVSPVTGTAPLTVDFSATDSYDPDGIIVSYVWDFGDNASASGSTTSHTFDSQGSYTVVLTLTDDAEGVSQTGVEIEVEGSGSACDNPTVITLPFEGNGEGQYCWFVEETPAYVNSWNLEKLTINGVDYTNTWSNTFPQPIDGGYYISYEGNYSWSHFEIETL